jgi:prepilin-type processing-associated H-X9-DG protein
MCGNNLKVIGLALHNYEMTYGCLPPGYTVDADGKRLHSWRTLILPFLEQQALYEKIDLSKPWDDPANKEALETYVNTYDCPSVEYERSHTTYLAVVGPNTCFPGSKPRQFSEITDDKGLTLMVIEVGSTQSVPWMSPYDAPEQTVLSLGSSDSLPHAGGTQAAFADGSVRFLSNETQPETLHALISINGNDDAIAKEID